MYLLVLKLIFPKHLPLLLIYKNLDNYKLYDKKLNRVFSYDEIKFSKALKFFRDCSKLNTINLFQHIGIYQYKMSTLSKYVNFEQSKNELKYSLEQYRAIDNNIFIDVVLAKKMSNGIDTMDEYVEIKKIMEYKS